MSCRAFVIGAMATGIVAAAAGLTSAAVCRVWTATVRLVKQLHDVDSDRRVAAAHQLWRERDAAALRALCSVLMFERAEAVRRSAAEALGNFRDEKALEALGRALREVTPVREKAILSISSIGGKKAVCILLRELNTKDLGASEKLWILGGLRASAGHVDPGKLLPLLQDSNDQVAAGAATSIAWIGHESVASDVLERIRDRGESLKPAAAYFAYATGEKTAGDDLLQALRSGADVQREQAALLLALIPGDESLGALVDQLKSEKRLLAKQAIEDALAQRGREGILELLSNMDDSALGDSLHAVSSMVGAAALDPLASRLRSAEEDSERRLLERCIVSAGEPEGVPDLLRFLKDRQPAVREAATEAKAPSGKLLLLVVGDDVYQNEAEAVIVAFGRIGDRRAAPYLLDALGVDDVGCRASAARALGLMGERKAVEPLLAILQEEIEGGDRHLACACVEALGLTGCRTALPKLISISQDPDRYVRCDVADALGRIGGPRVLVALLPLLWDQEPSVRRRAARGAEQGISGDSGALRAQARGYCSGKTGRSPHSRSPCGAIVAVSRKR